MSNDRFTMRHPMTKKDYIIIAKAWQLATAQLEMDKHPLTGAQEDMILFCFISAFGKDNTKFDKDKFIRFINN